MSECGASLAELRQAQNITENVRYRGSLITKRCDCRNSNGLDPMCKCTSPKTPKPNVTRSEASVKASQPQQPRRIFAQTQAPPTPNFKTTGPKLGINLNGDTIPIPARYKYRKQFPAVPDPNSQLHWMVRPETPPRPNHRQRNYQRFEEPPNHYQPHTIPPVSNETAVESSPVETCQQQHLQEANTNNFHGPETKTESYRTDSLVPPANPTQEVNSMNKPHVQQENNQSQQGSQIPVPQPTQEAVPPGNQVQPQASISTHAEAPSTRPQETQPIQTQPQQPVAPPATHEPLAASQCHPDPVQPSHPYHEEVPMAASVAASTPAPNHIPQSGPAPMPVHRPPTPVPAQDVFGQQLQAAEASCTAASPQVPQPQAVQRDVPPCPDRFYPCSHC